MTVINSVIKLQNETKLFEQKLLNSLLNFTVIDNNEIFELSNLRKESSFFPLSTSVNYILSRCVNT